MTNRILVAGALALGLIAPAAAEDMSSKDVSPAEFMKAVNADGDQTLSRDEVKAYAKKKFAEIESDKDKTLDAKELKDRVNATGLAAADTDKDATVDEAEFVGYADKLFEEANEKGKKTLSLKELETPGGRKLMMLLR